MKLSDLTDSERKLWQAAATGTLVDLRVGDPKLDSPERWTEWGKERTVRAEVIADLLIGDGEAAAVPVRGVRLQGARITGELNLEATTLRCPLALLDCSFASALNLERGNGGIGAPQRFACPGRSCTATPDPRRPPARQGLQCLE